MDKSFVDNIFQLEKFDEVAAIALFHHQFTNNPVYREWCELVNETNPATIEQIPFLPVSFFKSKKILSSKDERGLVFSSSGTTGAATSSHFVPDPDIYRKSFITCFERFYGPLTNFCVLGLLPSYLERSGSSLVMMVDEMIRLSNDPASGFYLNDFEQLHSNLLQLDANEKQVLLIGVTYALLDFAEQFPLSLRNTIVMETGGMKGRKKEITRQEVHSLLKSAFDLNEIHSEYGMTELLSQAYSKSDGIFRCPPWMKIMIRDDEDPMLVNDEGQGLINVIDLANIHSCAFLALEDIGKLDKNGSFEVMGRMDNSDLRGCSLLHF
ncbi:MAG: acyl transferase [Chitinophagaceae bacterium]|nr:acyl transferase [Chitinophagaceae bacterium]